MNPVERQLVRLRERWDIFRDDRSKRLLIWQLPDNAMRLAQAFFEAQQHELPYASGDLFLVFDAPFENSIQYSRDLKETLAGRYEASREDLKNEGIEPSWQFTPGDVPDSADGFIQGLLSFANHHPDIGHIAIALLPSTVTSDAPWIGCLKRMLAGNLPDRVRFVLLDSLDNPRLQALSESARSVCTMESVHMDAWATAQETFAQEPASGPAGVFRALLTSLFILVEKGSADQVMLKAQDALAFARRQQWPDQEVVVRMLAAGSMLKDKRFAEAVNHYRHAREAASRLAPANPFASSQLTLQSWFGEAGAHFCAGDVLEAARCYDCAAPIAEAIPNPLLRIEALRMSAQSYLQAGQNDMAFDRNVRILDAATQLPVEQRLASTLPIALVGLLRMVEPDRVVALESVKHQLDEDEARRFRALEQRAAEQEHRADAQSLRMLETVHAQESERLTQEAKHMQHTIAMQGSERFVDLYLKANELLGSGWLIDATSAILPKTGHADPVKRGLAS